MQLKKLRFKPLEAAKLLGISRGRLYDRIHEGRLKTVKDGRATFITATEILRYSEQSQPLVERHQDSAEPSGAP